ncbi:MAG: DMT family transporter [Acidobacteriaceae bacterium]|nr:DMT family transporter [Acidobacteriaceae bacterium]
MTLIHTVEKLALNGILIAIIAHVMIGISLLWDKCLLKRKGTQNLLAYVFWLGAISVFALLLIPFGFHWPGWTLTGLAFAAGLLDLIASYFYYSALKSGEASDELAAMGGFAPVFTALISIPLLEEPLGGELAGFVLLTLGGFLMFFAEKRPLKKMLPKILLAASGFALMNVLQKIVFNGTNFVSGYVFFTLGTFIGSMAMLVPPSWRGQILETSEKAPPTNKFWYMVNRFLAGVGSFLVVFALSRAAPSLVQAIAGVRYVVIFVGAYLVTQFEPQWFREDFRKPVLIIKAAATCLVVAGLVVMGMHGRISSGR